MTIYTVNLSSNSASHTQTYPLLSFEDHTKLTINLDGVFDYIVPIYVKIDWGDGTSNIFDNNIFQIDRKDVNVFKIGTVLSDLYSKEYYPSESSLYKSLTAQILIKYASGEFNWFILPIEIRTYDYFESIYDLTLVNTNIFPVENNAKEHQFKTSSGGFTIELQGIK